MKPIFSLLILTLLISCKNNAQVNEKQQDSEGSIEGFR